MSFDNNTVRMWKVPNPISGHLWIFGRIGSGKTVKLLTLAQAYHSLNYKIWDIFGGKRNEGAFWCIKNKDKKLWEIFERETYQFKEQGPKEYNVNLLYPAFINELPNRLPTTLPNSSRVKSKIFTIPIKDLSINDVKNVIGDAGSNTVYAWESLQEELTNNDMGEKVKYLFDNRLSSSKNLSIYKLFIKPLCDSKILSTKNFDLNLDFIEESKDRKTISVLCLDFVPERFKLFVMGYFQKKIAELVGKDKIHKKNILLYRETSQFMKIVDSSSGGINATQIFRNQWSDMARYGRSGYHMFADTQSPKEVSGLLDGQDDLLCVCEMPGVGDRDTLLEPLRKDGRIHKSMISKIAVLPIHQLVVIPRRENAKLIKRISPSRCDYWREGKGNFFTTWKNEFDIWTNTKDIKELIIKKYEEELAKIKISKMEDDMKKQAESIVMEKPNPVQNKSISVTPIFNSIKKRGRKPKVIETQEEIKEKVEFLGKEIERINNENKESDDIDYEKALEEIENV